MIKHETAAEIAKLTNQLDCVRNYIEHVKDCSAKLEITCNVLESNSDTDVDTELLAEILDAIASRYTARLDELNYLAYKKRKTTER